MSIKAYAFAAGLLLATQPLLCATAAGQSAIGLTDSFPFCAWWAETTATSLNVAFLDTWGRTLALTGTRGSLQGRSTPAVRY